MRDTRGRAIRLGCLALLALAAGARAAATDDATFDATVMTVRATDTTGRVDVYVQVPYARLSFQHQDARYVAEYDLTVRFQAGEDSLVSERTFHERVVETSYDVSAGRTGKVQIDQKSFALPPGDYTAVVSVLDLTAQHLQSTTLPVHVADFAHAPVAMSGILFASTIAETGGARSLTPIITADVSRFRAGIFLFFETYVRGGDTTLDAVVRVTDRAGAERYRAAREALRTPHGTAQQFVRLPVARIPAGSYTATLLLLPHAADTAAPVDADAAIARAARTFAVSLTDGVPATQPDLEKAVALLRWIVAPYQMDSILDAPTLDERLLRYRRFWDERDPTPGTPRNEARELYMARIAYANAHYRVAGTDGYATDMGMIYVIFGEPTSTENHPFETITYGIYHGPYQLWYYQSYNRQFVFIDQDGFGTFRLASPPPSERFRYGR